MGVVVPQKAISLCWNYANFIGASDTKSSITIVTELNLYSVHSELRQKAEMGILHSELSQEAEMQYYTLNLAKRLIILLHTLHSAKRLIILAF